MVMSVPSCKFLGLKKKPFADRKKKFIVQVYTIVYSTRIQISFHSMLFSFQKTLTLYHYFCMENE